MPLTISIDHARRRVRVQATGAIQRADVARSLAVRLAGGVVAYDQVWDLQRAKWEIDLGDLRSIAWDYRAALAGQAPGLLAAVASDDEQFGVLRQQEAYLWAYGREMMVCRSLQEAEAWLDDRRGPAPPASQRGTGEPE